MNRFKFRYWSVKDSVMLDWGCIMQTAFNSQSVHEQHIANAFFTPLLYRIFGDDGILMQWTGLQDRTGRPLYEGDIVSPFRAGFDHRCEVKWDRVSARFYLHREDPLVLWRLLADGSENNTEICQIVGNIYETPQLLTA